MNGWRILLVEDQRLVHRVVADALRTAGLPCEVVYSGREAVDLLGRRAYDLVILDVRLPDVSGGEVLHQIRQHSPHLPVILVTAYALDREIENALRYAPDAVLYKPFDIEVMLATVRRLLLRASTSGYALVSMGVGESASPLMSASVGVAPLVWLSWQGERLVATVHRADDHLLCLRSPRLDGVPPQTAVVEWYGVEAIYQFRTRIVAHESGKEADRWLVHMPSLIRRLQRRRHPRIPVHGRIGVSVLDRVQRAVWGQLVDLSRGGVGALFQEGVGRTETASLTIEWDTPQGALAFQVTGSIRHVVAGMAGRQPVYRVGIQFHPTEALPPSVRRALRQHQRARLLEETP
ncbi:MAG: hypothetical protein C4337_02485 [Armatimonadota bacterium]